MDEERVPASYSVQYYNNLTENMRKHTLKRAKIKLHDIDQQIELLYPHFYDPTARVDGFDYWLQDDEPLCEAGEDFFLYHIDDLIEQCIRLTEEKEKEETVTDNDTENRSERHSKSSIDDLISENTSLWNFLEELEHSEKLLKARIDYLTVENKKFKGKVATAGDEELKVKAITTLLEREQLKIKETTATIEEKREYIRHLENENERLATDLVHFRDLTHKNNRILKDLQEEMKSL